MSGSRKGREKAGRDCAEQAEGMASGGGHVKAAGARIRGSLDDAKSKILSLPIHQR